MSTLALWFQQFSGGAAVIGRTIIWPFPGGLYGKASACNAGNSGSIPGWEDPLEKEWQPTPVLLPGKFHGLRSLVGYSP